MPLARFLQSISGTCRHCGQPTGVFQREHPECRQDHSTGWNEMVQLATQAATTHGFNEAALRQSLSAIARLSYATNEDVERAFEKGWNQGVAQAMTDGIITRDEEELLRVFQDSLALENRDADQGALADLDRASTDRVMLEARLAVISIQDRNGLSDLDNTLR